MAFVPFGEWCPDLPALGQAARTATNVVPDVASYRPFPSLATVSNALTARCQGAAWFRGTGGSVKMFAGDATKLYLLSSATWSDVTRTVGGAYAPGTDGTWRFTQFGSLAIAVNGVDNPQSFDLAAGTNWALMAGSPPVGTFVATVRDFVVMGKIGSTPQRVQWSPYNNATGTWGSIAATQADYQDIPDGGNVTGLVGGEYGLVFSETQVRRMTYEGPPTVFRFDVIAPNIGCTVPNSVAAFGDMCVFLHKTGFYMVQGGQAVKPIGYGKVDRTFWDEFDETNMSRCSAAFDPARGLYVFAYPSNGSGGTPNRLLIYNPRADRWSRVEQSCEIVFGGVSQTSVTLEGLDAYSSSIDALAYSLDSSYWSGTVSLLLFGFDTSHKSGSFSGTAKEAVIETAEFSPVEGRRARVREIRPIVDGGAPAVTLGTRETQQGTVVYGGELGLTTAGIAPVNQTGRYFRVKVRIPAASTWSHAQGINDVDTRTLGMR